MPQVSVEHLTALAQKAEQSIAEVISNAIRLYDAAIDASEEYSPGIAYLVIKNGDQILYEEEVFK